MKYTLLDLVQAILSSMDSDEVNSIADTTEAMQVATLVKSTYFDIVSRANLPEHTTLFQLTSIGDATKPTLMTLPGTINKLKWIKYDWQSVANPVIAFNDIQALDLDEFMNAMYHKNPSDASVTTFTHSVNGANVKFLCTNNQAPNYYTSFDDYTVVFDSYDKGVDTTLQSSKTLCFGYQSIPWIMSDNFVPDLDDPQVPLLLNEAKALAWAELKQTQHAKAEKSARRGWTTMSNTKTAIEQPSAFHRLPNYGR